MGRDEEISNAVFRSIDDPVSFSIEEFTRALAEAGYQVVPVEPSEEIVNAIIDAGTSYKGNELNGPNGYAAHIYRAMLTAAK